MAKVEILEVTVEKDRSSEYEYLVNPDGLVKSTQLRILGRAFQNLLFDPEFDNDQNCQILRKVICDYFEKVNKNGSP